MKLDPLGWSYCIERVSPVEIELHLRADIGQGFFLYSQHQPENAIVCPTRLNFYGDDSAQLGSKPLEYGAKKIQVISALGSIHYYYDERAQFVKKINLEQISAARILCVLSYMLYRETHYLPLKIKKFYLPLEP